MDTANAETSTNKPPLLPKPCLNVSTNEPVEHVIPQMVITSADDEAEQVQDTQERLPELGVSTFETATSIETKELKDFNVPEETVQEQQLQNGNQAVEGTFDVTHSKSIPQDQTEFKHEDSVPHSVIQRPLIIESEKCISQSNITEINVQTSESPSPTPSLPPTTMQRPLVIDASSQQTDIFVLASEGTLDQCSPEISSIERKDLEEEALAENEQIIDGDGKTSAITKPKSSSFSWMPSFSKSHSSEKDERPSDALSSKKDLNLKETQKLQDTESSSKKDNLQNMKKFFDNLLHDTSADTKDKSITQDDHHESIDTNAKKAQKDNKHGVMKLFGPSKHEPESKGKVSPTPVDFSKETENATKEAPKESKFNVKKMLDSFIHDTKDTGHDSFQTEISKGKTGIASNDPVKEPEVVSKETTKDSKFNVKKMFDTFKHDTTEKKDAHDSSHIEAKSKKKVISTPNEPFKEPDAKMKDASKDSKFNVKKMFDSFKHDASEKKDIVHDSCQIEERSTGKISPPPNEFQKDAEISPKDTSKDSKFNMKKMFDSFKHDAIEKKDTVNDSSLTEKKPKEKVNLNANELPETTHKETSKDSKFNMKKMFDSFKHESVEKKDAMSDSVSGTKAPEASSSPIESDIKSKEASKDSKFNMKKMFDSFKHDSSEKKDVSELPVDSKTKEMNVSLPSTSYKESDSSSKDNKYNVTKMFDSFKHDSPVKKDVISEMSKSDGNLVTSKSHKDSKSGFKKFFDSFKHDEITAAESSSGKLPETRIGSSESCIEISSKPALTESKYSKQSPNKETITGITSTTAGKPAIQSKVPDVASEVPKIKPKDGSVRKFLHSFKLDGSNAPKEKHHVTFLERDSLKRSHSFRDSILLKDEQSEKISKDSSHGFKKYFMSPKSADTQDSEKTPGKRKAKIKRSESCKETFAEKEGFHGIKSFFDSFTHKKSSQISTSPEEHIYDTVGKPEQSTSGLTHSRDITKQVTTKTVDSKQKEDPSSMKKLFDSFRHKDTASKPKVAKETEKDGKDYEKVDISSNVPKVSESSKIIKDKKVEPASKDIKKESQIAQNVETQAQKNVPKIILNLSPKIDKQKKSEAITVPSVQVNGLSSSTDSKPSMFTAISDNFTAIKDKVMHSKESKRKEIESPEKESEEYDLQNAAFKNKLPDSSSGTYRPINDDAFVNIDLKQRTETEKSKVDNVAVTHKKLTSSTKLEESSQKPVISEPLTKPNSKTNHRIEPGTPETLYDTCCMRLATLLGKKALEIVSEKTKTPPKKPPKPSAEAIAKARAAVVSQRLRDLQNKGQSIGESIPVGYDGIRFADEETESSCDYKDVENLDYIIDYELVNRYKCDSKLDTFSDPSTCSGISSYYTADTVTLKDETFSDAPLETISLGNDSYLFQHLSSTQNETDFHSLPSKVKSKDEREKLKSLVKSGQTVSSSTLVPTKKVPPPLPPKPAVLQKQKDSQNKSDMSQCINGLSLSPRLQAKFSKDSAATQKRPLLVAGLKGTEFTSLQTKSKDHQSKERTFNTILKNESLKSISTIAPLHKPLQGTKSSPNLPQSYISSESSTSKKQSPQRPPPPISSLHTTEKKSKTSAVPPPVPEKPKRESRTASTSAVVEKRTVSPPRPPPPVFTKVNVPPPRPPPPSLNIKSVAETAKQFVENLPEISTLPHLDEQTVSQKTLNDETSTPELDSKQHEKLLSDDLVFGAQKEIVLEDNQIQNELKDESSFEKGDLPESNTEKSLNKMADDTVNKTTIETTKIAPKPPPRGRRIRSRTVEIPPKQKTPESTLRRSQSLSDADIEKRTSPLLDTPSIKTDLKHLYTSVNKDGKKAILDGSQSPNASRPLPAPPPPPRKFRSLDRQPKDNQKKEIKADAKEIESESVSPCSSPVDLVVKPPERKRKSDKQRFLSLSPQRKKKTSTEFETTSLRMPRSYSAPLNPDNIPLKPDRKLRHTHPEYDENANFAFPTVAEVHHSAVLLDECGNEIVEASSSTNIPSGDTVDSVLDSSQKINPHPRRKKEKNPKKSCSSWYDKSTPSEEWEIVDWDNIAASEKEYKNIAVKPKMRRRSDPVVGRKIRQTSKFYVNVEVGNEGLPLVDKETSPLHLDCSEKSVQTSLETLSVGIMSRDEQSDNPESSDNTDKLLNIVKTLQTELKTTLNRHKSLDDEDNDTSNAATDSERTDDGEKKCLQTPSIQSSTSEIWPVSSSEESDAGISNEGATNLSEIALKRKKNKIFYIAREILTSEEVFVDTLKLLNVDFKAAIEAANKQRNSPVVPDEVLSQILNHLPQLQQLNENLMMELKDRIDNWDKTGKIADVIVKIGPFLKLYSWYIHDFESNISLLEESKKKYPAFAQVIKEFEASSRCKRLVLNHFMLKPIQRIPQYRLLLQEYLHHLSEDSPDYPDTVTALQIVSEVAGHANDSMKQGDNAQKMISIQNSIMGHKEIIKPGRLFVKEGELMKLSRKGMQPRWFVLFNDLLLYLTPVQHGLYRINHELPLAGMKVAIPIQQDYQNEFSIISVTRSFTLAARSQEERQEWIVALTKAIQENFSKRSTFMNQRLQRERQDRNSEDDDGEFVLGKKAPVWIPDARVTMCQLCTSEFTVTFRRHHCRACGKVICSICSSNRISLAYLGTSKVNRVCDECYSKLGPDTTSTPENAETDSDNQQIAVKPHLRTEHRHVKKGKRNLPSVLKEVCANDQGSTISGYLQKRVGKSWKKEWFVVKDKVLYEYKASEDVAALSSTPLLGYQIESFSEAYENVDMSLLFQLTHPGQAPIVFHTDSIGSTERWIAALKEASVLE